MQPTAEPPAHDASAAHELSDLMSLVYHELRQIAAQYLRHERADHTLQTTALVHEAYVRLAHQPSTQRLSRAEFCATAARAIRRVLIDHARRRRREKRGGRQHRRVHVDAALLEARSSDLDLLELDEALSRLAQLSQRHAQIVELRFFGGLTEEETAELLSVSRRTVQSDWRAARAWLQRELACGPPD